MLSWAQCLLCPLSLGVRGASVQSTSGVGSKATPIVTSPAIPPMKHGSSKTLLTVHTSSMAGHTHGTSKTKTPDTPAKPRTMLSPRATASLAKFICMSDDHEGTPGKGMVGAPAERFLPRKQKSMMTQTAIPPLLPVRATCPKRKSRRGKRRRKCLLPMTRVVT